MSGRRWRTGRSIIWRRPRKGSETEFFQYLNNRGVLERLAQSYPLKRKKTEVPVWLYIASDLSDFLRRRASSSATPRMCSCRITPGMKARWSCCLTNRTIR